MRPGKSSRFKRGGQAKPKWLTSISGQLPRNASLLLGSIDCFYSGNPRREKGEREGRNVSLLTRPSFPASRSLEIFCFSISDACLSSFNRTYFSGCMGDRLLTTPVHAQIPSPAEKGKPAAFLPCIFSSTYDARGRAAPVIVTSRERRARTRRYHGNRRA